LRCKICLRDLKKLKFNTPRMKICGTCVKSLNNYREVAKRSYEIFADRLKVGMEIRLNAELNNPIIWQQERARKALDNFQIEFEKALPNWFNKIANNPNKHEKEYRIIRAHRRGLLHNDRPLKWGYPKNWDEISHIIRKDDKFSCGVCLATDLEIHVHHIVYKSNFGTDRKENLVSLCKNCHEKEHKREFDFGENHNANNSTDSELNLLGMELAVFHIEAGLRQFTNYTNVMVEYFGDNIKPYLLTFWEAARYYPDLDTKEMTEESECLRQFHTLINKESQV
jgi:5-methylcytosine-specific restriction endonuclease McrA